MIKTIKEQKMKFGCHSSESEGREQIQINIVTIQFKEKGRKSIDFSCTGDAIGYGPDYVVVKKEDRVIKSILNRKDTSISPEELPISCYEIYNEDGKCVKAIPLTEGELRACTVDGFVLENAEKHYFLYSKDGIKVKEVFPDQNKQSKKRKDDKNVIRNFRLCSPNGYMGTYWIYYNSGKKNMQFPVFITIRDLFRLCKAEGLDPLCVEENVDTREGYLFTKIAVRNLGSFCVEMDSTDGDTFCTYVTGIEPIINS